MDAFVVVVFFHLYSNLNTNNMDTNLTPQTVASDLDPHYLPMPHKRSLCLYRIS